MWSADDSTRSLMSAVMSKANSLKSNHPMKTVSLATVFASVFATVAAGFVLALSLGAITLGTSSPASAQTMSDCQSIAKPKERLACYDKIAPPIAANAKAARPATSTDLDKEDARMKQLLRPICRNC